MYLKLHFLKCQGKKERKFLKYKSYKFPAEKSLRLAFKSQLVIDC